MGFLSAPPAGGRPPALGARLGVDGAADRLQWVGEYLYLWCPHGVLASPFGTVNWEKELGVTVTMRN